MSILQLESLHPEAETLLHTGGEVLRPESRPSVEALRSVRAVVTRGAGRVDEALMASCPALRFAARAGIGLDNVDLEAARRRGITVLYVPGGNAVTTAEHTIALLLALLRRILPMAGAVAAGRWEARHGYDGDEAAGKTLGILGHGAIGRRVASVATALGMEVVVLRHPGADAPRVLPLPDLLAVADCLSLHLPLTPATRGILGAREFAALKPGAVIVNTARGALVDPDALAAGLASGRIGGYAADVLDPEPPAAGDPLLRAPRTLITPHVAALTASTYRRVCVLTARNVLACLRGEAIDPACIRR